MPDATDNDPWADLYADLGVTEKPARPKSAPIEAASEEYASPADESAEGADAEEGDEDGDEEAGEGVATADDGTPKKRRRRRRRGKKKPGDETTGEAAADAADDTETPEYGRNAAAPTAARQPAAVATYENDADGDADSDAEAAPAEVSAEAERPLEGATTEMTRELIANWNVPSWEELVTGLHRPSH